MYFFSIILSRSLSYQFPPQIIDGNAIFSLLFKKIIFIFLLLFGNMFDIFINHLLVKLEHIHWTSKRTNRVTAPSYNGISDQMHIKDWQIHRNVVVSTDLTFSFLYLSPQKPYSTYSPSLSHWLIFPSSSTATEIVAMGKVIGFQPHIHLLGSCFSSILILGFAIWLFILKCLIDCSDWKSFQPHIEDTREAYWWWIRQVL